MSLSTVMLGTAQGNVMVRTWERNPLAGATNWTSTGTVTRTVTVNGTPASPEVPAGAKAEISKLTLANALPGTMIATTEVQLTAKKESLGTQTMEGVNVEGSRTTSTIEAGAIGNDRPIQVVSERWYSPELQTAVMTRHNDPRVGEEIFRLTNVRRGEPGAYLFQVPAGYQTVEQKEQK